MRKRGQIQLSFGMIFSIIIIVASIAVAGYIIVKFLDIGANVSCKLFYSDLQKKIDKAWNEDLSSSIYDGKVPAGISKVCFGNYTQKTLEQKDQEIRDEIEFFAKKGNNLFFYPIKNNCKESEFEYQLKHIDTNGFFCVNVIEGKASLKINKEINDALVEISK